MKTYRGVILSRSSLGYTVRIPTLYDSVFGPLECITPDKGLSPVYEFGDQVIVVQASSDNDDLVILGYRTVGGQGGGPVEVTWDTIAGKPATFPPSAHGHAWGEITGKPTTFAPAAHSHTWDSITSKPTTFPPAVHAHAWADITSKPTTFAPIIGTTSTTAKAGNYVPTWGEVTSKPTTFAPSAHGHAWSEITGTPATFPSAPHGHSWGDISAKPTLFPPESHTHPWSQVTGTPATYPPSAHSHSWAETTGKPTTFAPIIGTTSTTAKAGNYVPTWGEVTSKPTTFAPSAHSHSWTEITSKPTTFAPIIGTTSTTAKAGNYIPSWGELTGVPATFAPSAHTHTWAQVTGTPSTYPPSAHSHSWAQTTGKPTTFAPAPHSHVVADIPSLPYSNVQTAPTIPDATNLNIYETDGVWVCTSTAFASLANNYPIVQGGLLEVHTAGLTRVFQRYTSFTPSSQRFHRTRIDTTWSAWSVAALWAEVGNKPSTFPSTWETVSGKPATYPPTIGATSVTAKAGNYVPAWAEITSKPTTFAPIIGTTSATAAAGNHSHAWSSITSKPTTFAPSTHAHAWADITSKPATFTPSAHTHEGDNLTPNSVVSTYAVNVGGSGQNEIMMYPTGMNQTINGISVPVMADKGFVPAIHNHSGDTLRPLNVLIESGQSTDYSKIEVSKDGISQNAYGIASPVLNPNGLGFEPANHTHSWKDTTGKPSTFTPSAHNHALATSSLDGFMAKADKALLDTATNFPTANSMVRRHSSGSVQVETGVSAKDAANKAYVDDYKILWGVGGTYMNGDQSISLSETVSSQKTGIVLCWSNFASGSAENNSWNYQFVPKWHVSIAPGTGVYTILHRSGGTTIQKYVYIGNTSISGNASNTTAPNNTMVLRAVLGV